MKSVLSILNALTHPVLIVDTTLRAVVANPAFLEVVGATSLNFEGMSLAEILGPLLGEQQLETRIKAVLAENTEIVDMEIDCEIPAGTPRLLSFTARRVYLGAGLDGMALLEVRDVMRERAAELKVSELNEALRKHGRELEAINSELESFTHSVSHDLKTPLRFTNKIAHLLLQEHADQMTQGAADKLQMILDSTDEMGKLVEDLLRFSQLLRDPVRHRSVDMEALAREAADELLGEYEEREVEIVIEAMPPCMGDESLLKQVYLNLLANALKFTSTREKAVIRVGHHEKSGQNAYFVNDNGVGFSTMQSADIFIAFRRMHKEHHFSGSGIGLAIVKRIIERHEGVVWAEGEVDTGATIYFTLNEELAV